MNRIIKFLDLTCVNPGLRSEFCEPTEQVIDSGWYIRGSHVELFERQYAEVVGSRHCTGVGNGLDAIVLILRSYIELGLLKEGDEVLVPANTYIAPHRQLALNEFSRLSLPITEEIHRSMLSIPLNSALSESDLNHITAV
jgi:dTDP-4-amino-4,6-dideoxygalactose transaminase